MWGLAAVVVASLTAGVVYALYAANRRRTPPSDGGDDS